MFEYEFMRKAFVVGLLLSTIIPCIGVVIVLKRLSMLGDALSHTSLAGVAGGLILGINPVLGSVIFTLISGLSIDVFRKKFPRYSEISIAITMSAGVGLAGVLSGFTSNSAGFSSFLFGSIVAITNFELYLVIILSIFVMLSFILLYKELMYISFDETGAKLIGIRVKLINFIFTILTALTVSIAARTVGALIISSIMVIPVACAMRISKSYKWTVIIAIIIAIISTIIGLTLSFYYGLKPGGTIVLTSIIFLIISMIIKK